MDTNYVLCKWKGQLWPAKVLSRPGASAKNKRRKALFLEVQILSVNEKIKVKSTEIKILSKSRREALASSLLTQSATSGPRREKTAHKRSHRAAWNSARGRANLIQKGTSGEEVTTTLSQNPPPKRSASLRHPNRQTCKGDLAKNLGKSENPTSLVAPSESHVPQCRDNAQRRTTIAPTRRRREGKPSQICFLCQNSPPLSRHSAEKEGKEKVATSPVMSTQPPATEEGAGAPQEDDTPMLPSPFILSGTKTLKEEAQGSCPRNVANSSKCSTFSQNTEGPREGRPQPGFEDAATSSSSSQLGLRYSLRLANRRRKLQVPDIQNQLQALQSLDDSEAVHANKAVTMVDGKERGQPAGIAFAQEPRSIARGMIVWFKYQEYPFWPAVVTSVQDAEKTARVLLIEADMNGEESGLRVPLRRLKRFDCKEKEKLVKRAEKGHKESVHWCCSLISDYRGRVGRGSFVGSFLEYYAADISFPIRKAAPEGDVGDAFPRVTYDDLEESEEETSQDGKRRCKRILPDRMRASWARANQKLVEFIVQRKGADDHLLDILQGRKPSHWLKSFLDSNKYMVCIETYLEDDEQLDAVVKHLQEIYKQIDKKMLSLIRNDKVNFILEVLLPEAIICSISALDGLDYKRAEAKYLEGPPVHYREKELFDRKVIKERRRKLAMGEANYTSRPRPMLISHLRD
ncbi:PWWP domain-containing DNA repair factor 3B-like [Tamandua tetradactyla]|uniref:PWWP domain-containing DNA repair factor 3B-like n=1 Tax=Tamandua tetradactyla TaxID=48850 RepID=UPI0040538640